MVQVSFNNNLLDSVSNGNDALKFNLYLKTREIKQVAEVLQSVQVKPPAERQAWVNEHEDMMSGLLDAFVDDASGVFDGLYLDTEAMNLSMEFVTMVRDVMNTLQGLTGEQS